MSIIISFGMAEIGGGGSIGADNGGLKLKRDALEERPDLMEDDVLLLLAINVFGHFLLEVRKYKNKLTLKYFGPPQDVLGVHRSGKLGLHWR
jgi:hypothetical protein